jgi:hypothetical protein
MEATMRKFFLVAVVLLSATAARAGLDVTASNTEVSAPRAGQLSSGQQGADAGAAQRQAMMQQKAMMRKQMMMQKQMAMQREMQRHPIRTRVHFALLNFKRKLHRAFN